MVCNSCLAQCGPFKPVYSSKSMLSEQILQAIQANTRNSNLLAQYRPTRNVEKYFETDEEHSLWKVPCYLPNLVFTYDEMIQYELLENGNAITRGLKFVYDCCRLSDLKSLPARGG